MIARFVPRLAVVAVALVLGASSAGAGTFLTGFTGSNQFTTPNAVADGVVNYTVYQNTEGDLSGLGLTLTTQLGNASAVSTAQYIYIYQVVNSNPQAPDSSLTGLVLNLLPNSVLAAGYSDNTVFDDGETTTGVGPVGNQRLGLESTVNNAPLPYTGTVGFTSNSSAVDPTGVGMQGDLLRFSFFVVNNFNIVGTLPENAFSSLLFVASNVAPQFGNGTLVDGGSTNGIVPVATPEPGTLALLALGGPLAGLYMRRRAGRAGAAAAV